MSAAKHTALKAKQPRYYRGGGEGSMPKGVTARHVVDYERKELGNKIKVARGVKLHKIKSERLAWLTGKSKDAKQYGKVKRVEGKYRPVAHDSFGGFLAERLD